MSRSNPLSSWNGRQWTMFVDAWTSGIPLPLDMTESKPTWFHSDGRINTQSPDTQEGLNTVSALMWTFTLQRLCDKHHVHPVDIEVSHDLTLSSIATPYIGSAVNPLEFRLLLDTPSYTESQLEQLHEVLGHLLLGILKKRGGGHLRIRLDDVQDFPHGYTGPWRLGTAQPITHGLHQPEVLLNNPQVLHGWRSRDMTEILLAAAASGGIPQRGELYLRWLDGMEQPSVTPLNESTIETHWPGALNFFRMWSSLGIRERATLKNVLQGIDKPADFYSIPDSFTP